MKKLYLFAALATMLAACSENDLTAEKQVVQQNAEEGAVQFSAYVNRGTTRAGNGGTLTTTGSPAGTLSLQTEGFGVFGYYTNNEAYSEVAIPDFMYNQFVSGPTWTYAPIKYWPNEFGSEASSERVDYLSFFAYAPWVDTDPRTGKLSTSDPEKNATGILGMSRNTAMGDPLIKYAINFNPAKCVDLCWGVAAEDFKETVTSSAPRNDIKAGDPFLNVIKPAISSKIKFDFKHALSQLNIKIDTDVDFQSHAGSDADSKTRIFVRSVSFEGFTDKGTLNLNSPATRPIWYNYTADGNLSTKVVSVYDGRYDGREGVEHVSSPNELPQGLNTKIVQNYAYKTSSGFETNSDDCGVTHTAVNLFNGASDDASIFVIPNGQALKIKVVYDVETYDSQLSTFLSDGKTHGSTIENAITKTIRLADNSADMILEAGKKYTVTLHLGLTSVKFDASVSGWDTSTSETNADLPINAPSYSVGIGSPAPAINIPFTGANGIFEVTGLAAGALTAEVTSASGLSGTATPSVTTIAAAGDNVTVTYAIAANEGIQAKTGAVKVTDAVSAYSELPINQAAHPLGLATISTPKATETDITLSSTATIETDDWKPTSASGKSVWTVVRNRGGVIKTLTYKASAPGADEYTIEEQDDFNSDGNEDGKVKLGTGGAQAGDVYTITVQAGNAAPESVSFTVEKILSNINAFAGNKVWKINDSSTWVSATTTLTGATGSIVYSIAKTSGSGTTIPSINPSNGTVTLTSMQAGDVITVTATAVDGANHYYNGATASYTITIE